MNDKDMEINIEHLKRKIVALNLLTNLLFVLTISFPIILNVFYLVVSKVFAGLNVLSIIPFSYEMLIPYAVGVWLYFSDAKYYSLKKKLQPLTYQNSKYDLMHKWLEDAGVKSVLMFYYESEKIEANAFGTKNHRYIAVSQKALDILPTEELKILILHESGHHAYGDSWKYYLSRYLALSVLATKVVLGSASAIVWAATDKTTLLSSLPNFLSFFIYVIASLGVLLMARLRELLADNFAIQHSNDIKSFKQLFLKISLNHIQTKSNSGIRFSLPRLFSYHPTGTDRLKAMSNPNLIFDELYPLLAFAGLLLGAFIGFDGRQPVLILFSMPVICISGSLLFYYVATRFDLRKKYGALVFAYSATAALSSSLFNLAWTAAFAGGDKGARYYYVAPLKTILSNFFRVFDNYLLIISMGSLYILVFSFLFIKTKDLFNYLFPQSKLLRNLSTRILLVGLFLTTLYFWLYWVVLFGQYPIFQYVHNDFS